jgi:hypothetical protein
MTAKHAHGAGAVDAKSREWSGAPAVALGEPADDAAQRTGRAPGRQVS